jgi:hypothetical protein
LPKDYTDLAIGESDALNCFMRLFRNATPALALVVLAVAIVGCKAAPSLVGKWSANLSGQNLEFEFKPDGTSLVSSLDGPIKLKATGTYKVEDDKIEMTTTKVDIPGAPPQILAAAKVQEGQKKSGKITFTSNDDVQLTIENQNVALKRKN